MIEGKNTTRTKEAFESIRTNLRDKIEDEFQDKGSSVSPQDLPPLILGDLRLLLTLIRNAHQRVGEINPRNSGLINFLIQQYKKFLQRSLTWYTRPIKEFQDSTIRYLQKVGEIMGSRQSEIAELKKKVDMLSSQLSDLQKRPPEQDSDT